MSGHAERLAAAPRRKNVYVPTEDEYLAAIIDAARWCGWRMHHCRPARSRTGTWATPIQGDAGFPDLVVARAGAVQLIELKTDTGRLSEHQRAWLTQSRGFLWRPGSIDVQLAWLQDGPRPATPTQWIDY